MSRDLEHDYDSSSTLVMEVVTASGQSVLTTALLLVRGSSDPLRISEWRVAGTLSSTCQQAPTSGGGPFPPRSRWWRRAEVSTRRLGSSVGDELLPARCVDPSTIDSHGNGEQSRGESRNPSFPYSFISFYSLPWLICATLACSWYQC
jgi:hypothetical protein